MEQQISDLTDQMSRINDEGTQLDQDLEENQSERNVKYRDLRKREETMDQVSSYKYMCFLYEIILSRYLQFLFHFFLFFYSFWTLLKKVRNKKLNDVMRYNKKLRN